MHYQSLVAFFALAATAHAHGVIVAAQGSAGTASRGFLVNTTLPRDCINISPCQQDSTLLRDQEMNNNVVNACGRTELNGNVDVGQETEIELAAKRVTTVTKGSTLAVTIHQVNADGAGPYTCDLDPTSNSLSSNEFIALNVTNNVPGTNGLSQAKFQNFTINVKLPADLNCTGASTGNICTVRCRNNALAGPFGGCFAVQQSDGAGRTNTSAAAVNTAASLTDIQDQVNIDQADIGAALAAHDSAVAAGQDPSLAEITALAGTSAAATAAATSAAATNAAAAATTSSAKKGTGKGKGNANTNANTNTNANANTKGNGNANTNTNANANADKGQKNNENAAQRNRVRRGSVRPLSS